MEFGGDGAGGAVSQQPWRLLSGNQRGRNERLTDSDGYHSEHVEYERVGRSPGLRGLVQCGGKREQRWVV